MSAPQVALQRVETVVPLLAGAGQPVARFAPLTLRLDEAGAGQRGQVLRDGLPRHRQLAGQLGRGRRARSER